jgi:hypothetical protein
MLLPREQSPWNCAYYLGAIALKALSEAPHGKCDLLDLQQRMTRVLRQQVSATQVVSASAWLFLIGAVGLDQEGMISDATR